MRALGFIGADQHTMCLFAQVGVRIGVAHHRKFLRQVDQLLQRLGDDVVVQHVADRHVVAGPRAHHVGIGAGSVDHMLASDVALVGDHLPLARGQLLDVGDKCPPVDFGAALARTCRHGVRDVCRGHVAVSHGQVAHLDAEGLEMGMVFGNLVGANQVRLVADQLRHAVHLLEPLDFLVGNGQANAAAAVPRYRLAGQLFQFGIEQGAFMVNLGQVERADEVRALAGRMPGGAGRQFALFHQHHIAPAFLDEVVQQAHPHDAAADDNHARM
jgi:hypothetical protein